MEMNEFYEAPEVEVLEVKVERGFAGSGPTPPDPSGQGGDITDPWG